MKRLLDVVVSLAALILLSPVLAAVAVAVVLDSGGPVLFRQQRVGRGGGTFPMLKFRTMAPDAAARGPHFTSPDDPRITRVALLLPRPSPDELPQLWNVLLGQMSLVGPRPDVPAQQADYRAEDWSLRCSVRPGITGLAQATLRSHATPQQRLRADLDYVRSHTLLLDFKILWWTLRRLGGAGAH